MPAELAAAERSVAHRSQSAPAWDATRFDNSIQAPVNPTVLDVAHLNSQHDTSDNADTPGVSVNTQPLQLQTAAARSAPSAMPLLGGGVLALPETAAAGSDPSAMPLLGGGVLALPETAAAGSAPSAMPLLGGDALALPETAAGGSAPSAMPLMGADTLALPETAAAGRDSSDRQGTPSLSSAGQGFILVIISATVYKHNFSVFVLDFNHISWAE